MSVESLKKPMTSTGNQPRKNTGLRRVINAFFHSMDGLGSAFKHEAAFRQEVILAIIFIPLAALLPIPVIEKALLAFVVMAVLIAELLNSAVEWVVDYVSLEKHPFAKKAKDMGSAAVLLALTTAGIIWILIIHANWDQIAAHFAG